MDSIIKWLTLFIRSPSAVNRLLLQYQDSLLCHYKASLALQLT
jgi:hypothetical protein